MAVIATAATAQQERERRTEPAGMPVRWAEGMVHGFLTLSTPEGAPLASGDWLQIPRNRGVESRMTFHFRDSSFFEETVLFSQREVFELKSYKLVQRGPAFARDLEATLEREGGRWRVETRERDGRTEVDSGTIEMHPDVYNGMIITLAKNLAPGESQTVHLVAFTPKPRMIRLELQPSEARPVRVGDRRETTVRYTLKPKLGFLLKVGAAITGQTPPDSYTWIVTHQVPAFVRFQGPLYSGPVWRIDLTAPRFPEATP